MGVVPIKGTEDHSGKCQAGARRRFGNIYTLVRLENRVRDLQPRSALRSFGRMGATEQES